MLSKPTRRLVDITAFAAIAWMWAAIYQSFTHTGVWAILDGAFSGSSTMPGQAVVLSVCFLIGWLSLAAACYLVWRWVLRGRLGADFPRARSLR